MELLLLAIYGLIVWLIFIKFKWLPWNFVSQAIVIIIPIVGLTALVLLLNIFSPSSHDTRVINYVVQIVPRVTGRVLEVPVEGNRFYKKGEVLLRIDPEPFENELKSLTAALAATESKVEDTAARVADAQASGRQLGESLKVASGKVGTVRARLDLARLRVKQNTELVASGAGERFALEQAEADLKQIEGELASASASEAEVKQKLSGQVNGELATVASARAERARAKGDVESTRAKLANAKWSLSETVVYAPADGYVINLQLRPGATASSFAGLPVMSFVEQDQQVVGFFAQNELHQVEAGNEAELAFDTLPGQVLKAKVDSIVWVQGQGTQELVQSRGAVPETGFAPTPPGRFMVKFRVEEPDRKVFLAAGARGQCAIYTNHLEAISLLRRVVIRVSTKLDYLILKLH
jgi:multidrug resistance efflux pump